MLDQVAAREEVSIFGHEELFFSRTDERGVILAGNDVFFRVSKYSSDQMIGAPHKIVRHPDMPKGLFWLIWDRLGQGLPVGAYVKNLASDGSYYWVYAIMSPAPGGYLSIRLKPSSGTFEQIEKIYADLRSQELTEDLSAEASARRMLEELEGLGWSSYSAFMIHALVAETQARDKARNLPHTPTTQSIVELQSHTTNSLEIAQSVLNSFATIAGFPVNMQIQASKLKASGKIFGSIADNYERLCRRVEVCMKEFIDTRKATSVLMDEGLYRLISIQYASEMSSAFEREANLYAHLAEEADGEHLSDNGEAERIRQSEQLTLKEAQEGLGRISSQYKDFSRLINDMLGVLSALSVTQFVGLVETARLNQSGQTLNAMLQDVTTVQNEAIDSLNTLANLNNSISSRIKSLSSGL